MKLIRPIDIIEAIAKIEKESGDKVRRRTHCIYASETISFTNERYPLEIKEVSPSRLPKGILLMIAPKRKVAERRRKEGKTVRLKK